MKVHSRSTKITSFIIGSLALLSLSSCNLMGFADKPSGDIQLLDAARACLDKGDYSCARDYYQAISSSYSDVKISETSLTNLAGDNIFFIGDLVKSLGSGTGSLGSFITLAQNLSTRGITTSANRVATQKEYANSLLITDSTLRNYMRFVTSMAMMGQILAAGAGTDHLLEASDLSTSASACKSAGACNAAASCDAPSGTSLLNTSSTTEATSMASATNWGTEASLDKLVFAFNEVDSSLSALSGNSSGLATALGAIQALGGGASVAAARCSRQLLIKQFFP